MEAEWAGELTPVLPGPLTGDGYVGEPVGGVSGQRPGCSWSIDGCQ